MASLNSAPTAPAASRPVALNYQLTTALPRVSNDRGPQPRGPPSTFHSRPREPFISSERAPEQWENWGSVPRETYSPVRGTRTWFALGVTHQQESNFESISTRWIDFSGFDKRGNVVHRWLIYVFDSYDVSWCDFVCEFRMCKVNTLECVSSWS